MKTQNKLSSSKQKSKNRWHLSAEGFLLLPSALRPHLLGKKCKKYGFRDIFRGKIVLNCAKLTKNAHFLPILALFQIVAVSTIFSYLCSTPASAASLTLTIPSKFSLDVTPGAGGVFSKSQPGNINVKTDNSSGYTLSIKAKNNENSNSLVNSNISINNKLNSISEQTSEDNFKSDSKFNNTWGYLPSKFNNEDNTNFLPGPTTEESLLETTEEANETGTDYNITLGAKIDNTMSSGSYNNDFIFSATANAPKYDAIMQDWSGCASLPDDDNTTINLLDTRDNNIYKVAKLKDGKCWMVENLRLGDSKLSNRTLTSANTDITASTYQLTAQTPVDFNVNNNYDADALYIDSSHPEYGGYYSWHTATAGTGTAAMSSGNATSSICPKGWKLPTGGSSSDFNDLVTAYGGNNSTGSTNLRATPVPGFVYSGRVYNDGDGLLFQGSSGYYWSSTVLSALRAYTLLLDSSDAYPAYDGYYKYFGYSVRCVTEPKKTMQTVDQWGGDVKDDEVVEAVDTRDGNTYKVSKLKDGKLWMTQNLKLGDASIITRELTPDDTDISEDFTLPESDQNNADYPDSAGDGKPRLYLTNNDSYGNYYNWFAATAGTGTPEQASGDAPSSICPKGWRLPTQSEIATLTAKYTYATAPQSPANFVYSGRCNSILCPVDQGALGRWWTSTANGAYAPYSLYLSSGRYGGDFYVNNDWGKGVGVSVRCVAKEPKKITDLTYMQDWGDLSETEKTQVINSMQDETNYTLKDKRDDNEYTIAKLKDDEVWMTQNLRLGDEKLTDRTLTSENTDISDSTYQLTEQTPVNFNYTNNGTDALYIDPNHPEYGGYYSWHTATAGTGTASMSTKGENATSSICPKGWKLPTGGSSSDFNDLVTAYGGNNSTGSKNLRATTVPGFVYGGYVRNDGNGLAVRGSRGYYWSSTVYSAISAYFLYLYSSDANPANYHDKYSGHSVRCVVAP